MKMYGFVKVGIASAILPYYGQIDDWERLMKCLCRLSSRTWTDYEQGLITQIRGKLRKIYDFNVDEEIDLFSLHWHRYDIQLDYPDSWQSFYRFIMKLADESLRSDSKLKLYWIAPIEVNGLSLKEWSELKYILKVRFNVPPKYLRKLDYPYSNDLDSLPKKKSKRNAKYPSEYEIKSPFNLLTHSYDRVDAMKVYTEVGIMNYHKFIEETKTEIKHLKVQEPWDYLKAFRNMSKVLQMSVHELEIFTKKPIRDAKDIGDVVAWFPYCQILSFYTRNVDDFGKIWLFMKEKNIELVTNIYKLQYNHTMWAHTILHGIETDFEVYINRPSGDTTILKIKAESFSILIWRNLAKHGQRYLYGDHHPYYIFENNYGVILKGTIDIEVIGKYSLILTGWFNSCKALMISKFNFYY